ncbi:histamine H3 receptor-like [Oncorhynchus keta]|uniref:histamine H3 receptor-like n=1 Tax=Oncorhynchus keta TaxID=8018 RepID=UPI0015FA84F5|nr:histamine H3 receptor-like [Oncorhynchus keta]
MGGDQLDANVSWNYMHNDSTKMWSDNAFTAPVMVILLTMMVILVVVIVLGNALVIFAFKVDKSLRRQSNYYFLNLAISDFLVGAFCIPVYIPYILTGRWMLGRGLCKLWLVMDYLLCTASVFNIVLISYDRFLSVTRAVSYRARQGMTHQAIMKMIAVWVLAFVLYGPAIIFWELVVGKSRVPEDECYAEFYYTWYFLLSASMLEFFSPLISVTFFNLSIYLNIRRRRLRNRDETSGQAHAPDGQPPPLGRGECLRLTSLFSRNSVVVKKLSSTVSVQERGSGSGSFHSQILHPPLERQDTSTRGTQRSCLSRDKKIAKSLAVIVCVFAVCWAPYTLLMIIRAACKGRCVQHHWYEVTFWLLWLNSAINPFLYPLCHSSFRRAFGRILCPRRRATQLATN